MASPFETVVIEKKDIGKDVQGRLVKFMTNPSQCPCGWYEYKSAVCGHLVLAYKYMCGRTESLASNNPVKFCPKKGPKHIVEGAQVAAPAKCKQTGCSNYNGTSAF